MGVSIPEITDTVITVFGLMQLGFSLSAAIYITMPVSQRAIAFLGFEPMDREAFKSLFDRYYALLFGHVLPHPDTMHRSPYKTKIMSTVLLGLLVIAAAVTLEILSLGAVFGVAYAGYHLAGLTFDLNAAYQSIVAGIVFLTMVCMTYGNLKIKETARYT